MLISVNKLINALLTAVLRDGKPFIAQFERMKSFLKDLYINRYISYKCLCLPQCVILGLKLHCSNLHYCLHLHLHFHQHLYLQVIIANPNVTIPTVPLVALSPLVSNVDVFIVSLPVHAVSLPVPTVSLPIPSIRGLPVAGLKKKQEKYGVALRVQCVTLFDASIPLNVICSRWFVTKSSVYRWKRIAKARSYNPDIDPRLLCTHVEDAPRSSRPSLQTYERTRKMIVEVCNSKEGRNLTTRCLRGKLGISAMTVW
jgi:hypothetical protein